ncbi:peptidoglycan DD-metalloendopeptidase family protein [Microcoleus sp. FACHB-1515]|nr:peptidoglycan DD-metalloendopeptidase family protein [Microcoleus sp. FACHB-1515]
MPEPNAAPDAAPVVVAPSPAASDPTPSPTAATQTIRLEAARQRVEAHLAAIVARDRAAKAAQLQQNLVAAALRYAEAGNFEQARRTAEHPALPEAIQAETLAKIATIALLREGATTAAAIAPAATRIPVATASTAVIAVTPTPSALPPAVPARAARFARAPFRPLIGQSCLPQQAKLLSVTAPSAVAAPTAIASPPTKAIGPEIPSKSRVHKASVHREVVIPESIELRSADRRVQPIEVKLTGVVDAIPALVKPSPVAAFSPLKSPLSGLVSAIVQASQQDASPAALPSLPVVYVDAKVNRAPAAQPAVAANCEGGGLTTIRYSVQSSMQRLTQLGFAFPLPIPAAVTSAFGWRIHPISGDRRFHAGVDFGAPMGTPVLAALPGQVVVAGSQGGYGLTVILENEGHRNLYAHLSAIAVQPGQVVNAGSIIGWVGSTGNSTGPHLHFESQYLTAQGWQAVDPLVNGTLARGR